MHRLAFGNEFFGSLAVFSTPGAIVENPPLNPPLPLEGSDPVR